MPHSATRPVLTLINAPEPPQPGSTKPCFAALRSGFYSEVISLPPRSSTGPLNANNLLLIKSTFHYTPSLPAILNNEGVGRVLAIGLDLQGVKVGDRVQPGLRRPRAQPCRQLGKTPVLSPEEARELFLSIPTDTLVDLRDRALIGVLI